MCRRDTAPPIETSPTSNSIGCEKGRCYTLHSYFSSLAKYWRVPVLGGPKRDKSFARVAVGTDPTVKISIVGDIKLVSMDN